LVRDPRIFGTGVRTLDGHRRNDGYWRFLSLPQHRDRSRPTASWQALRHSTKISLARFRRQEGSFSLDTIIANECWQVIGNCNSFMLYVEVYTKTLITRKIRSEQHLLSDAVNLGLQLVGSFWDGRT
jgi:hypothetical protein